MLKTNYLAMPRSSSSSSSSSEDSRRSDRYTRRSSAVVSSQAREKSRSRSYTPQPNGTNADVVAPIDPEEVTPEEVAPRNYKRPRDESVTPEEPASKKFSVGRSHSKNFRKAMSTCLQPADARAIRKRYEPDFLKRSVSLQCPKIDHSMARRMKERKGPELTKVEQKEKSLTSVQFKLLDIARPLLFISESLSTDQNNVKSGVLDACSDTIRLLGHAFASITAKRRENILKFTDPRFESLLKDSDRFDSDDGDDLFGSSFLRSMVKDADDDAKLRNVNRASEFRSSPSQLFRLFQQQSSAWPCEWTSIELKLPFWTQQRRIQQQLSRERVCRFH